MKTKYESASTGIALLFAEIYMLCMKRHKAATVFIWDIWKKKLKTKKKLKKNSKVENQNISYGRAS